MAILKILARTTILFVCSIIEMIGVLVEGICRLLSKLVEYLMILDNKLIKKSDKKVKKTKNVPTKV